MTRSLCPACWAKGKSCWIGSCYCDPSSGALPLSRWPKTHTFGPLTPKPVKPQEKRQRAK